MKTITDNFLFAIGAGMLIYELVVWGVANFVNSSWKSALISPRILSATQRHPWILLFVGYLLGHLTWPQPSEIVK